MIAFTSDLLPRYIYTQISSEKSSSLDGYVAWALSASTYTCIISRMSWYLGEVVFRSIY